MKLLVLLAAALAATPFQNDPLTGAWQSQDGSRQTVWIFTDGYAVSTTFDKANRQFIQTWGGPYTVNNNTLTIQTEFHTADNAAIGSPVTMPVKQAGAGLQMGNGNSTWKKLDDGNAPLAGNWQITGRLQDGKLVEIQRTGTRKTLKLLSGTRFQWVAIDPAVKGFYGTGGGVYSFANGKYTENIEFFSRDSTRVGASLTFDGKIEDGAWMHSGLNSRGEPLNEVWRRKR